MSGMERMKKAAKGCESCVSNLIMPDKLNSQGHAHGGELVKYMDNAAGIAAVRFCGKKVVTARMDDIEILSPVELGAIFTCIGEVTFVGRTSIEVLVEGWQEKIREGKAAEVAIRGYFTMVALEDGRPSEVPELLLQTEAEWQRYEEGRQRYELRKERRAKRIYKERPLL